MFRRLLALVLIVAVAAALLVLAWPQLFDLQQQNLVAQAVSLRGVMVLVAVALMVVLLVVSLFARPFRRLGASFAVLLLAFAAVNGAVLAGRGFGATAVALDAESAKQSLTVLSWNTLGPAVEPAQVARLALQQGADIVVLPETIEENAIAAALQMREGGRPMWVLTRSFDKISPARSTSLLISAELGEYEFDEGSVSTSVLPTLVATPIDGTGPTIVAVHAVAPLTAQLSNWRSDLSYLAGLCDGGNIVMAGDFNATLDHLSALGAGDGADRADGRSPAGSRLGECTDAAAAAHVGAFGTWPTSIPALLGAPIDHIFVSDHWSVGRVEILDALDGSGSDHRPIVAEVTQTP